MRENRTVGSVSPEGVASHPEPSARRPSVPGLPRALLGAALAVAASTLHPNAVRADAPGDVVVARVGQEAITARELERRLAPVPAFQLRSFGKTGAEIQRAFLERVLIRERLLAQGADAARLEQRDDVQERLRGLLRTQLLGMTRAEAAAVTPVTDADLKTYYDANAARFHTPERIALWRILVPTREEALGLIEAVKKETTPARWNDLAREKSLDKSSGMRGGNLGFVAPDGTTSEPDMKVDPALVRAASLVKDGELVPVPVREGQSWAVLWRRQTMRPVDRTLAQETPSIKQILTQQRAEERVKQLTERLRAERATDIHLEYADTIEVDGAGELQPTRRPGTLPFIKHTAIPQPMPSPGGLR